MNEVTIVSKTHMKNTACVGGILKNGRYVRLLKSNGYNHEKDTDIDVGDVYKINFHDKLQLSPPHLEDIIIDSISFQGKLTKKELTDYLINDLNVKVWTGEPDSLFDGKLKWTHNCSGYISEDGEIPNNSVGFWLPKHKLTKKTDHDKIKYQYLIPDFVWRITYVGYEKPLDEIAANTLLRVSLARWWDREGQTEKRCYLQLSGWFDVVNKNFNNRYSQEGLIDDDLPF